MRHNKINENEKNNNIKQQAEQCRLKEQDLLRILKLM